MSCRICHSGNVSPPVRLTELMFRTGESFYYFRCEDCGCLQIAAMPDDMGRHYPDDYYSFAGAASSLKTRVRDWLALNGPEALLGRFDWFTRGDFRSVSHVRRDASILDIGCGSGQLISTLRDMGYSNVAGVDPFIAESTTFSNGVHIHKAELADLSGQFDVVMMHHSLEHVWDQQATLAQVRRLLKRGGEAIIRIPTIDSRNWRTFGTNWAHLDPPRHFYLHSRRSIRLALEQAGLTVVRLVDDSNDFGIVGSIKAQMGKPSIDPSTVDYPKGLTRQLNRSGQGDAIAVHAR